MNDDECPNCGEYKLKSQLEKLYGRTVDALYCPACETFKPLWIIGSPARCPACNGEFVLVTITIRRYQQ